MEKVTQSDPEKVAWLEIAGDGTVQERTGHLWAAAPALQGMRCVWAVLPAGGTVRVCRASRRHRAGLARSGRYIAKAGRYIDIGTWFTETDPRSRFHLTFKPPRYVVTSSRPNVAAMNAFATLLREAAQ